MCWLISVDLEMAGRHDQVFSDIALDAMGTAKDSVVKKEDLDGQSNLVIKTEDPEQSALSLVIKQEDLVDQSALVVKKENPFGQSKDSVVKTEDLGEPSFSQCYHSGPRVNEGQRMSQINNHTDAPKAEGCKRVFETRDIENKRLFDNRSKRCKYLDTDINNTSLHPATTLYGNKPGTVQHLGDGKDESRTTNKTNTDHIDANLGNTSLETRPPTTRTIYNSLSEAAQRSVQNSELSSSVEQAPQTHKKKKKKAYYPQKCPLCPDLWMVETLYRHAMKAHLPYFLNPWSCCWDCEKDRNRPNALRTHILEPGHPQSAWISNTALVQQYYLKGMKCLHETLCKMLDIKPPTPQALINYGVENKLFRGGFKMKYPGAEDYDRFEAFCESHGVDLRTLNPEGKRRVPTDCMLNALNPPSLTYLMRNLDGKQLQQIKDMTVEL